MPKRGAFALGLTAIALVLLLNFQTPSLDAVSSTGGGTGSTGGGTAASGTGGGTTASGTRTVMGPVVNTRWGAVQVEVTLDGTELVDVSALQLPDGDRRSSQISDYTEPLLRSQALEAQGASIDGVSGATYTSIAYARSLQAALDGAGA
ncbi:MAG: FMN-binding protein [Candidatus Limnocylindrales bacterium]